MVTEAFPMRMAPKNGTLIRGIFPGDMPTRDIYWDERYSSQLGWSNRASSSFCRTEPIRWMPMQLNIFDTGVNLDGQ